MKPPNVIYGSLFDSIQLEESSTLTNSIHFADAIPKYKPETILNHFSRSDPTDLNLFVKENFVIPIHPPTEKTKPDQTIDEYLKFAWIKMKRYASQDRGSLIGLPYPYLVPGGRFNSMFYWDSYFTMLGLLVHQQEEMVEEMCCNFKYLIEKFGFIPNGNRTYFLGRSQPPFFAKMVGELLPPCKQEQFQNALESELSNWKKNACELKEGLFFRYFDTHTGPRPESYKEDVYNFHMNGKDNPDLYHHIRTACASGWDFSTRWEENKELKSGNLLPVDLNSLVFEMEGNCPNRIKQFHSIFWDPIQKWFFDYDFIKGTRTKHWTLAGVFPLYTGIATQKQAYFIANHLESKFLRPGGLVTTLTYSHHQWDAPNGWAPLQWISIIGLRKYGFYDLADKIKERWLICNQRIFNQTGQMVEKYNVEDINKLAEGGEYSLVMDGFGWTNGVYIALQTNLDQKWFPKTIGWRVLVCFILLLLFWNFI